MAQDNLDILLEELRQGKASSQPTPPGAPSPSPQSASSGGAGGDAPQATEGALGSALTGVGDTATFGFLDEASGFLETLGVTAGTDAKSVWSSGKSFGDTLADNIAYERSLAKADADKHPYAFHGGQLGGAFLVPFGAGAKGALQVAKVGAVQGAVYGVGSGEGVVDRAEKGAEGAVVGGVLGAALGKVGSAISSRFGRKAADAAVDEEAGIVGSVTDETPWPQEQVHGWSDPTVSGERQPVVSQMEDAADELVPLHAEATANLVPAMSDKQGNIYTGKFGETHGDVFARNPQVPLESWDNAEGFVDPAGNFLSRKEALAWVRERQLPGAKGIDDPQLSDKLDAADYAKQMGEAGTQLGSISRAGLQDLQSQVEHFRGKIATGGDRAVDLAADAPQGAFRLGNLGDEPETISLLGALVRQLPSKVGRSDEELMATARAASEDIGAQDPEAVYALAQQIAGPLGDADTSMAVLRTVTRRAADTIDQFHGAGLDWTTATDEMVQEAGAAIYNSQRLASLLQNAKTGVGRGLRTMALPDADTYLQALAKGERVAEPISGERGIPPLPGNREELRDFFELWGMTKGNPEQRGDLLSGTLSVPTAGHYLQHSFANMFTASILSAPKTLMLNLVGPTVINTVRSLEKMGGGAMGAINPMASAEERQASAAVAKLTPIALFKTLGEVRDVFRYGVQAFQENHSVLGGGGTVKDAHISFGPYNSNLLRAANVDPTFLQSTGYSLGNALNIFPKALARVNAGLDEMAKRFTYLQETRVRAMVEAAGKGLEGSEAAAYVSQAMKGSMDEAGAATSDALLKAAERSTLTYQPGVEGNLPSKITKGVQTLRHDYPLTRFILPVFTVPANAIGETLRRVPIYNRMPWMVEHAADLAGENGAVSQAEAHGRTILGGSFLMGSYLMNQAGVLTGAGPQDPTDAKIWRQTHEPYSIRIGDQWVSYRKLDILGGLLAIPATVSDASVYHKVDEDGMFHAMLMGVGSLATWFKDQGAMRQATDFLALGDNPMKDPAATVERMFGGVVAGLVPASGLIRTLGVDTTDPYVRMKKGWEDYVKAGIPGWGEAELEPLRNVLGEPINRPANSLAESVFPVTLAPVATYAKEPVLDELGRLYQVTGYGAGADPKSFGYGFFDPQEVKLEDGRSLYFHAMQARATMKLDGVTLKQALGELFDSPEYNEAIDADSSQRLTSQGDESRGYLTRAVFDRYNKAIKAEVAAASPLALKYLTAGAAKQRDDAYLRNVTAEQLVNNPDLYSTNGIDPQAYSDKITDGAAGDLLQALGQ